MKVALVLEREATEAAVAGADAYWLVTSPENRKLAERLRATDDFDPNSAVFDGDRHTSMEDAVLCVLDNIDEHHPEWTEIAITGIDLGGALQAALRASGRTAIAKAHGFIIARS